MDPYRFIPFVVFVRHRCGNCLEAILSALKLQNEEADAAPAAPGPPTTQEQVGEKQGRRRAEELEKMTTSSELIVFYRSLINFVLFIFMSWSFWTSLDLYDSGCPQVWPYVLGYAMCLCQALLFFYLAWALPNTEECQMYLAVVGLTIDGLFTVFWFLRFTLARDTHEVPPDASFALFASWGPLIGYTLRHTCLADGLSRQRWRREAENRVRDRTIMFEGKISEEWLCLT